MGNVYNPKENKKQKGCNNCYKIVASFLHIIYRTEHKILNRENEISQIFLRTSILKGCAALPPYRLAHQGIYKASLALRQIAQPTGKI